MRPIRTHPILGLRRAFSHLKDLHEEASAKRLELVEQQPRDSGKTQLPRPRDGCSNPRRSALRREQSTQDQETGQVPIQALGSSRERPTGCRRLRG